MKIIIREARLEDLPYIVSNNMAMAEETEGRKLDPEKAEDGARAVLEGKADALYYVVEVEGKIACQTMITKEWSDWRNGYFWWIQSVYTLPEFRGKGLFKKLYDYIASEARKSGACGLRLYVDAGNKVAQRVYEKLGMVKTNYLLYEEEF